MADQGRDALCAKTQTSLYMIATQSAPKNPLRTTDVKSNLVKLNFYFHGYILTDGEL